MQLRLGHFHTDFELLLFGLKMDLLPEFDCGVGLLQFLDLLLKIIYFGCNISVGLLQTLEVWDVIVEVKQGHELIVLGTELIQLFLYYLYLTLHI
jgi:hypothetical protein